MRSVFTPALGSVTHVAYDGVKPTTVRFSAAFTHAEYYDLKRAGGIVQLWTDIPVSGRERGWGAISFVDTHLAPIESRTALEGTSELSLISTQDELDEEAHVLSPRKTLSLQLDLQADLGTYSFTYRIVYPSGGVWWLGEYGRNGVFVVESVVGAGQVGGITLEPGWQVHSGGWTRQIEGETTVGHVSPGKFKTWAISSNGLLDASLQEAVLLLFLPRPSAEEDVIPPSSALVLASGGSTVSIKQDGTLSAIGEGSIYVQSPADHNIERVLSLHSSLQCQVLSSSTDHNHGCVVLFNQTGAYTHPRHGLVFPSSCSRSPRFSVELPADNLVIPGLHLALHSPATSQTHFLTPSPTVTITAPSTGGSFVLAPVYSVSPHHLLLFTSPHIQTNAPSEESLPVPPSESQAISHADPTQETPEDPSTPVVSQAGTSMAREASESTAEPVHDQVASKEEPAEANDPPLEEIDSSAPPSAPSPDQKSPASPSREDPLAMAWKEKSLRAFVGSLIKGVIFLFFVMVLHRNGQKNPLSSQPQRLVRDGNAKEEEPSSVKKEKEREREEEGSTSKEVATVSPDPLREAPQATDDLETKSDAGTESTFVESPPAPGVPEESLPAFIKKITKPAPAIYFDIPPGLSHMVLLSLSSKGLHLDLDEQVLDANFKRVNEGVHEALVNTSSVSKLRVRLVDSS